MEKILQATQGNTALLHLFILVTMLAIFNAGIGVIADKWNVYDIYDKKRVKFYWLPKWCQFCFFFWTATVELQAWYWHTTKFDMFTFLVIIACAVISAMISLYFFVRTK